MTLSINSFKKQKKIQKYIPRGQFSSDLLNSFYLIDFTMNVIFKLHSYLHGYFFFFFL